MSTRIHMKCDGCDATHDVGPIRKTFDSFNGKGHGFGVVRQPDIDALVEPTGWVWSDPYTYCTYCPQCWAGIVNKADAA